MAQRANQNPKMYNTNQPTVISQRNFSHSGSGPATGPAGGRSSTREEGILATAAERSPSPPRTSRAARWSTTSADQRNYVSGSQPAGGIA